MKYFNIPIFIIGITFLIAVNLWVEHKDTKLYQQYCEVNPSNCEIKD